MDLASACSTARPCPVLAAGDKEDETEKRLMGVLILAALARAEAMQEAVTANLATLVAQSPEVSLMGSAKEMNAQDAALKHARETLQQLEGMVTAMQGLLTEAMRQEEIASLRAAFDTLDLQKSVETFAQFWRNEYPRLADAIVTGVEHEAKVVAASGHAQRIVARLTELGETTSVIPNPSTLAVGVMAGNRRLSDLVRLPGVSGAPFVGMESYFADSTEMRTVQEDVPQDALPVGWVAGQGGTPAGVVPTRFRRVQVATQELRQRPARDDAPLWPADPRAWTSPR